VYRPVPSFPKKPIQKPKLKSGFKLGPRRPFPQPILRPGIKLKSRR
jgi:hypothetical protein